MVRQKCRNAPFFRRFFQICWSQWTLHFGDREAWPSPTANMPQTVGARFISPSISKYINTIIFIGPIAQFDEMWYYIFRINKYITRLSFLFNL